MTLAPLHADLHCHSTHSDGMCTPSALAAQARAAGITLWALTDHDVLSGQAEAQAAAHAQGIDYLTGVEISASFAQHTIHIVGLGMDIAHPPLVHGLQRIRDSRIPRAQAMARQLAAVGIEGAYEGALRYAGNPALIARTHFARFLIAQGVCSSMGEVFRHYLVEGKPGYVPQQWASLEEAVQWITGAGGVAVIAHPARYGLSDMLETVLVERFRSYGGQAIEVVTGSHTPAEAQRYAERARDWGLAASCGSDFHSPQESSIALGRIPALPRRLTPVWDLLPTRIQRHRRAT